MLYYCPSVGTMVQYCHMAVARQISYSRVFAHWKGYAGNLQGKYNAGNQSSGVLSIRSFPAQVLYNVAWIPCHLVNSCNGQQSGPAVSVALRRLKVLYRLSILFFIGQKSPTELTLYDCNYIKLSLWYRVHLALQVQEVPRVLMELM